MHLKRSLKKIYGKSGVSSLIRRFRSEDVYIFNYHRIRDNNLETIFDDGVFGSTEFEFIEQMTWLKKNFKIWSEQDFLKFKELSLLLKQGLLTVESLQAYKALTKGPIVAVTFDDGYECNYRIAFPVLKKLGVPAIFFIPTLAIESRKLFWWDHISYIIKKSPESEFVFRGKTYFAGSSAAQSAVAILSKFRSSTASQVEYFIPELLEVSNSVMPSAEEQCRQMMTWEQIVEISQSGFAIGSHTHSHRILSQLSLEEQRLELSKSKSLLQQKIGSSIHSLAYPCGQYEHFNQETKLIAKEEAYDLGFSFLTGQQKLCNFDFYDIKRVLPQPDSEMFEILTSFPKLLVKNMSCKEAPGLYSQQEST